VFTNRGKNTVADISQIWETQTRESTVVEMQRISYPHIQAAANSLGVHRSAIWYALIGRVSSPDLVKSYFEFAIPRILSNFPLPELPEGTRILLPAGATGIAIGDTLKNFAVDDGNGCLTLIAPLRFCPWHPIAEAGDEDMIPSSPRRAARGRKGMAGKASTT
jgi:hypothetical protein